MFWINCPHVNGIIAHIFTSKQKNNNYFTFEKENSKKKIKYNPQNTTNKTPALVHRVQQRANVDARSVRVVLLLTARSDASIGLKESGMKE